VDRRGKIDAPKRCLAIAKQRARGKIEVLSEESRMIKSVRGVGYVFTGEVRLV
jgi:DNA-binding response OmpR family regulator